MRRLFFIIQKEFIQIFRNKAILPLITIIPLVQLILLSYAASNEVTNVRLAIFSEDQSAFARLLINKIKVADRFEIVDFPKSADEADRLMQNGKTDITLSIPFDFERRMLIEKEGQLQLLTNAINGTRATVGTAYLTEIIQSFNNEIRLDIIPEAVSMNQGPSIDIQSSNWYNPELNFQYFMTPGILGELVTILVMLLTAMNIVREREIGTIEQINVTPIRKWEFILGKLIPFWVIGFILLIVGLIAAKLIFDIPMVGSLALVFGYCAIHLIAVLGLGLFISNISDTQQQALFTTFFVVIIFILMSGLFTPIESMPLWAQKLTIPNPIAHFVNVMRSVLLKGSEFMDIIFNFKVMIILAVVFNILAVVSYRKTT